MYTTNGTHIMYGSWGTERDRQFFFLLLNHFLPFYSTNNPENQNFEKMKKKTSGDIINLHLHTTNEDHIMYGCWDLECYRDFFFFFFILGHFLPFFPPNNPENQIFEKMKKTPGDIITLNLCTNNENHDVWFQRWCTTDRICCHLRYFLHTTRLEPTTT